MNCASQDVLRAFQAAMRKRDIVVYESAFRVSDCCARPLWRVCFGGGIADAFICKWCHSRCNSVAGERLAVTHEGRSFIVHVNEDRIVEGDHVHACGFYERALIARLRQGGP